MQDSVGVGKKEQPSTPGNPGEAHSGNSGNSSPERKKSGPGGKIIMLLLLVAASAGCVWAIMYFTQKKEDAAAKKGDHSVPVTVATASSGSFLSRFIPSETYLLTLPSTSFRKPAGS